MNPLGGSGASQTKIQTNPLGSGTIVNPLDSGSGNVNIAPKMSGQKLEDLKELPKEYKNDYLERLGKSPGFNDETSLFE